MDKTTTASSQPSVLVLLQPGLYKELFTPDADARLRAAAAVTFNTEDRNWTSEELAARLPGFDAVITGWGSPRFTDAVLDAADHLRLIAHSAGSIKAMLPPAVLERDIQVTHAAAAIAPSVAEMGLLLALLCLRPVHKYDRLLKAGELWEVAQEMPMPQELGVSRMGLDELMSGCPVVSVQAPVTAETHHMLGARELALLKDGAVFINTARSQVVDQDALLAELQSGRIQAALDVFDQEPLPVDSPFRRLENVIISPHIAGASRQARLRQGEIVVSEIERFFSGQPLRYRVSRAMLETMA